MWIHLSETALAPEPPRHFPRRGDNKIASLEAQLTPTLDVLAPTRALKMDLINEEPARTWAF